MHNSNLKKRVVQELQSTPSEAPPQLSQMHTQLDAILTAVGQSQNLSQTVSEARDQIHTLLNRLPDASATAAPAGHADQKLTKSIAGKPCLLAIMPYKQQTLTA